MRLLPPLGVLVCCLAAGALPAQEPTLPKADRQDPERNATTNVSAAGPQLIPPPPVPTDAVLASPALPDTPTILQLDEAFKQNPVSSAAENLKHHQEWRELRNRISIDPAVRKALAKAEAARTDLEKRRLLRQYYELYFGKMITIAPTPELKAYLNDRKNEQLGALSQPRVRPAPSQTQSTPVGRRG